MDRFQSEKHIILFLSMSLLLSFTGSACQENPSEDIVQGKNANILESRIQESRDSDMDQTKTPVQEPFSYHTEFSGAEDSVTVKVDADGTWQTNLLPVIRVRPRTLTAEDARKWGEVLTGSHTFYEPKVRLTKSEIEKILLEQKRIYEDEDTLLEYYAGDRELAEWAKSEYEKWKTAYEAEYAGAPDTDQKKETDWMFHPSDYYQLKSTMFAADEEEGTPDIDEKLVIDAETENGFGRITAWNYRNGDYYGNAISYSAYSYLDNQGNLVWDASSEVPVSLTEDQMLEEIAETLERLDLGHFQLYKIYRYGSAQNGDDDRRERLPEDAEEVYAYSLLYVPSYGGLEVTKQNQLTAYPEDSYGALYDYEKIGITFRNDGITELNWTAPLEIVEVENPDVSVLPFSEICELFQNQMQVEYTLGKLSRENPQNPEYETVLANIEKGEIHVEKITFGLVRIQIPNNYEEFRLVPAWCFRGMEALDYGEGYNWMENLDSDARARQEHVYQTINAIDGTFINVALGY